MTENHDAIEAIPGPLRTRVEAMRQRLLDIGVYRIKKRGKELPPWVVSVNGARCAVLLEDLLDGLHHLPRNRQKYEIDWGRTWVEVPLESTMSSWDFSGLTTLVLLAHHHAIRAEITPRTHQSMSLYLHPRRHDATADTPTRHPDIDELVERATGILAQTHR